MSAAAPSRLKDLVVKVKMVCIAQVALSHERR